MKSSTLLLVIMVLGYLAYTYIYKAPKYTDGEAVADFQTELIDGTPFKLSEMQGKYVLLDFWGSWCGPCRMESPALVKLYKDFGNATFKNASGFNIVSVAIETSEESWKKAILADQLAWKYHIVQKDRFKSEIAQLYKVREIPTKYLLDTNGNVLMVNPSFKELSEFLAKG